MEERAIVRLVEGSRAVVEVLPEDPASCASCGGCREGPSGRFLEVDTVPGLEPGHSVTLDVRSIEGLGPPTVAFLVPVVAVLVGAVLGSMVPDWAGRPGWSRTALACVGAMLLLAVACLAIRRYDRALGRRGAEPRIVRVEG